MCRVSASANLISAVFFVGAVPGGLANERLSGRASGRRADGGSWLAYEHALLLRRRANAVQLKPLDVLEALCASVLASTAYPDKRMRVAICNILLQRVQASVPIERSVQTALNAKLFATGPPGTPRVIKRCKALLYSYKLYDYNGCIAGPSGPTPSSTAWPARHAAPIIKHCKA